MAIITTLATCNAVALDSYARVIEAMAKNLLPEDQQSLAWSRVSKRRGTLSSVLGRRDHVRISGYNILAGVVVDAKDSSWKIEGGPVPDGSYVAVRASNSALEVLTDYTGSTTIWHGRLKCGGVVASTSFELVIALIGDFSLDRKSLGWYLSSGTVGPRRSWDRRVKPMAHNSRLTIQQRGDEITVREVRVDQPRYTTTQVDADTVRASIAATLESYDFGSKPWLLALSGGYDSRAMLFGTRHVDEVVCVTWVDEMLMDRPGSDVEIASILAKKAGRKHVVKTLKRPSSAADLEAAARRFVRYCDGRVDNLFAYLDGMQIWDEMSTMKIGGLLRGDELFGSAFATRDSHILHNMRLDSFSDFATSDVQRALAKRYSHEIPVGLLRRKGESASHWRWRLRSTFEIPTVYAALNSIRARFLQNACPLLSRNLVDLAGAMPSPDHDDRALYTSVVSTMYPDVPIASTPSVIARSGFLNLPSTTELLMDHVHGDFARDALGARSVEQVVSEISARRDRVAGGDNERLAPPRKRSYVPTWVKRAKRQLRTSPRLDLPTLAMRSFLAELIKDEMEQAAANGNRSRKPVAQAIA